MIAALRSRWRDRTPPQAQPHPAGHAVPDGERIYAIGDIHGRADLFDAMIEAVDRDDAGRGAAATTVILLGDLVDRGPDSAGVIDRAIAWGARRSVRLIAGNHEEMFLDAFDNVDTLRHFLRYGGDATVLSYPVRADRFRAATHAEAQALMAAAVPAAHRAYLAAGEPHVRVGDYLFVHAGIMPGVPFDQQPTTTLRWIREPFLGADDDHGCCVVHGHTITDEPEVRANRIGIDTGAYLSGRLTALCLEGTRRWLIEARDRDRAPTVLTRET